MTGGSLFHMNEADGHLEQALEHHAAGRHAAVKRRIELARAALERAIEAHPDYVEPTHDLDAQGGAETSDGRQPRDFSPEAIRARDQRRAIDACYKARLAGGRR